MAINDLVTELVTFLKKVQKTLNANKNIYKTFPLLKHFKITLDKLITGT